MGVEVGVRLMAAADPAKNAKRQRGGAAGPTVARCAGSAAPDGPRSGAEARPAGSS
ncbi:MAG: hypothetical protein AVDCRST_MAG49-3074 [uncultured Thermomicrobiales bacterium]|uniref:Uncharacterized protein n=1 Tax=uncultured Thermomicrobiales bacterium TaxID=1645740 RepID=A0A6J4V1Z5_9BACT|nr:MAG: hypothetical protein AVDCRST_MAG49-3074 [uncultured Thermomicrobiales bacterium]